ncbi:MAG: hypothetical protein ACSLFQ_20120 [Thermoanaerobaculia bacterium]
MGDVVVRNRCDCIGAHPAVLKRPAPGSLENPPTAAGGLSHIATDLAVRIMSNSRKENSRRRNRKLASRHAGRSEESARCFH